MNKKINFLNLIKTNWLEAVTYSIEFLIVIFLLSLISNELAIPAFLILLALVLLTSIIVKLCFSKIQKKKAIILSTCIFTFISSLFYMFSSSFYSISGNSGLLNYIIYAGKIVFIACPTLGFMIFVKPNYSLENLANKKKILKTIFINLKDILLLILSLIVSYVLINASYVFWAIPIFIICKSLANIAIYILSSKQIES